MLTRQYTLKGEPLEIYCIDTSALVEMWRVTHRPQTFPSLWQDLEKLIKAGKLVSPEEVFEEIKKRDDDLFNWCKQNKSLFKRIDQEQIRELIEIEKKLENFGHFDREHDADPWVLALASVKDGIVISQEKYTGDFKNPSRIPDACRALEIPHKKPSDFFEKEGFEY